MNDSTTYAHLSHLVTQILDLNKCLATTMDPHGQTVLKRQIEATDEAIDKVVYGLYNLTPEEIEIIKNN